MGVGPAGAGFKPPPPQTRWMIAAGGVAPAGRASEILYFRTLRNIKRFNWLILYLYGASPAVPKSFEIRSLENVIELDDCYLMPYATSLRMSDIGYQNSQQSSINISFDNLDGYTRDLLLATRIENREFINLSKNPSHEHGQLSSSLLQIEDEYYAEALSLIHI